jgi:PAS domain S-box-containing protein
MAQHKKATIKPKASSPEKSHLPYILLVEDEPTHVAVMRHTIQSADPNAVVKVAGSLQEYRSAIAKSLPDIVLIDMYLPDGKALEVLTSPPEAGSFPIVVMISSGDEKIAVKAMKAGALDYVVKTTESFKAMPHTIERSLHEWNLIQERKQAAKALSESELRFRSLYENVAVGLYRTTPAGKILLANRALVKMLGYSSLEQLAERNLSKVGFAQSSQRKVFLRNIEMEGEVDNFESAWIRQDGSLVIVRESARAIRDSQGKTLYYDGVVEDITERRLAESASRHAEDALQESEEKYHDLYTNAALGIFHSTIDGRFIDINPALARLLGYDSPEEAVNSITNISEQVYAEPSRRNSVATAMLKTGGMTSIENNYRRRDGTIWNGMLYLRIVRDQEGKPSHYEGFVEDITERKRAEKALRESEEKFSVIFKVAPGSMILTSLPDGKTLEVNDNFSLMTGYSREEALGKTTGDLNMWTDPYDRDRFLSLLKQNGFVQNFEADLNHKSGTIRKGVVSGQIFMMQDKKYLISTFYDITERKQAEMELSTIKILLEQTFEQSPIPMVLVSMPDAVVRIINPACREFLGVKDEPSYIGTSLMNFKPSYMDYDVQGNIGDVRDLPLARAITGQKISNEERFIVRKDGTGRWELVSANPIYNNKGEIIAGYLTMNDITDRKRSEVLLKQSETRYRLLADHMKDTIWLMDMNLKTTYISPSVEKLRGYTLKELQQLPLDQQFAPASFQLAMDAFSEEMQKVMADPTYFILRTLELEFYRKDGTTYWSENRFSLIRDENGRPESIMGEGREITDRKRAEEALQKSSDRLHLALESANSGTWEWDLLTNENIWSDELWKLYGLEPHSCVPSYELWRETIHPEDREKTEKKVQEAAREGKELDAEWRVIGHDGAVRWLMSRGSPSRDANGNVVRFNGIVVDITERKKTEEALRESESRFRELWGATVEGITILDKGIIIEVNDAMCQMFGYAREHAIGKSLLEFTSAEMLDRIRERIASGIEGRFETPALRADGTRIILEAFAKQFIYQGKSMRMVATRDITDRKRAEEALRESETRYRSVLQSATDAIVTADSSEIIIGWNRSAERIFGYSYTEAIGQSLTSIMPLYHHARHPNGMKRLQSGGDQTVVGKTVDLEGLRKDGSVFPLELSLSIWETKAGRFFTGIIRDITERKRAEEKLQESQALYHSLVEQLPAGVFRKDYEGRYDFVSTWFCRLKKMRPEEFLGKTPQEVAACDAAKQDTTGLAIKYSAEGEGHHRLIMQTGKSIELDEEYTNAEGSKQFIHAIKIPVVNSDGKITGTQGILFDITERKRIEEELRTLSMRQEAILSAVPDIIMEVNNDKVYTWANRSGIDFFGNDVIGKEALFYFEGEQDTYKIIQPLFKGDDSVIYLESWQRRKDGEKRLLAWWCRVLKDPTGKISGALSTARDITGQKLLEEQLRQMQKLEGLGTLAGGIAHDFNNILGIILAYNTSIERSKGDAKKLDLAIETITKAVQRGKTLVQQILTFARKTETAFEAVNVNDVVMEIMTMIFETFPKVLTYSQNFEKGMPCINADRSQLNQALLNLCVNARDAMPSGGVLTINTRMVSVTSLRHQHPDAAASSYVCIEVSDTGEGMTEETQMRIFEPFFTTKGIGKGTGLGLSVVFGVVHTHKGFIDVESELGKGTTFRLYLPASQVAEPISVKDEETLEEIPGGTETLLVVEDEEMLMMSLRMVLVEKGYNVLSAGDGLTALKIYQERKNDIALVLTDLGLPNMTGLEVCQRIKTIKPNEHMILATGFLDPEMKSEFLKAGIQHFLYKPYDLMQVLKVIREVLDGK